ncbi:MAG: sugar ABC transporter permease [Oscillospiraceae bacterium]|nr:sugar ABC transporter permease [Oscillospiraceae bacterium]
MSRLTSDREARVKPSGSFHYRYKKTAYLMLAPALILLTIFVIWPLVMAVIRSFLDYNSGEFVGLYNFIYILKTPSFVKAFKNVLLLTASIVALTMLVTFLFALLMRSLNNRFGYFTRACVFIPFFISGIVAAIIFDLLTNYGGGLFTSLLISAGKQPFGFAVEGAWPYITIIVITIWLTYGYQSLIMYAGLLQIPKNLYEAAQLDGANFLQQTLFITLPNMKNYFVLICISLVTANLQMFEIPFMVTGGGPLESTLTPVMYLYNSFRDPGRPQNVTIAGALLVMILIMTINIIVFKTVRSEKSGE